MNGLLPIGRFSAAARLSIKALRLYDEKGLLRPTYVDPQSARRYYSPAQIADAEIIRRLRELDLPLAEIRELLAASPTSRRERLSAHRAELADELDRRGRALTELEELIASGEWLEAPEVRRRERPATPVVSVPLRTNASEISAAFARAFRGLYGFLNSRGAEPTGPPLARYQTEDFDPEDISVEIAIPVARPMEGEDDISSGVVAGGSVASALHRGGYDRIHTAYVALGAWIAQEGLGTSGPPEEIYLIGPDRAAPAELRTEVAWPLESRGANKQPEEARDSATEPHRTRRKRDYGGR